MTNKRYVYHLYHLYHLCHCVRQSVWINNLIKNTEQKVTFLYVHVFGSNLTFAFCHWRLFWFAPTINQFPISVCRTNWKLQRTILLLETPATKSKKQNNFKGFSSSWIFTRPICQFVSRIFTRPKATLSICHLRCFGLLLQYHSTWERRMYKTHFFCHHLKLWVFSTTTAKKQHPNDPN